MKNNDIEKMQHVYIIGSKGIPAKYGGFETFVEKLSEYQVNTRIKYHVACMLSNSKLSGFEDKHFEYNGADCFNISVPNIGPAKAVYYDIKALKYAVTLAEQANVTNPVFYVLACRIGPFIGSIKKKISEIGGKLYINPDGHEWLRAKWSYPVRQYWKISEKLMIKYADRIICDSKNIQKYITNEYKKFNPKTTYIAYGTDISKSGLTRNDTSVREWYAKKAILENNYYLIVGRFVPENNYEVIIENFLKSKTDKDLVIITNVEKNRFFDNLEKRTKFSWDERVKFVGTVYNQELLKYIRENAFAYIHGHEVGGTNPSLLEALASSKLNLLLDVGFNREVGEESSVYWKKNSNDLAVKINLVEQLDADMITTYRSLALNRIKSAYTWESIVTSYENLFLLYGLDDPVKEIEK